MYKHVYFEYLGMSMCVRIYFRARTTVYVYVNRYVYVNDIIEACISQSSLCLYHVQYRDRAHAQIVATYLHVCVCMHMHMHEHAHIQLCCFCVNAFGFTGFGEQLRKTIFASNGA
jgi:hypothetical protein